MGMVFYSLGLLGSKEAIEVSSGELVGQYVGTTAPRVKRQMEAALGKVLFVDEAYRLAGSSFGIEAIEEILKCLSDIRFQRKLIVILAGYSDEMDALMAVNPGLPGRFQEVLEFPRLGVEDALTLLRRQLINEHFAMENHGAWNVNGVLGQAMGHLVESPNWANGRDIDTLRSRVHNAAILQQHDDVGPPILI